MPRLGVGLGKREEMGLPSSKSLVCLLVTTMSKALETQLMTRAGGELSLFLAQDQSWLPAFGQPHVLLWLFQSCCTHTCAFFRLRGWQP